MIAEKIHEERAVWARVSAERAIQNKGSKEDRIDAASLAAESQGGNETIRARRLKASETRYRRLFEAAQDGILILDAQTGMIDDVNPFLIAMLGYSRRRVAQTQTAGRSAPFSDSEASRLAFDALQQRRYIRYEDLPLKTKDGRLIPVEFVSNVYVAGEKDVIQCNIRDITERKRLELAQAEDERRLRDLLQNSADGITLLDAAGRVIWESPATANTQGYYPVQWIGKEVLATGASGRRTGDAHGPG